MPTRAHHSKRCMQTMSRKNKDYVSSCFECIAASHCYGSANPHLSREDARSCAAKCTCLRKGLSTETIRICGYERGVSRKNAEKMVNSGKARWVEQGMIEMLHPAQRKVR